MTAPTWHYGVTARWWAEFNTSGPEIDYFRRYVEAGSPHSTSAAVPAGSCSPTSATASTSTAATSRPT